MDTIRNICTALRKAEDCLTLTSASLGELIEAMGDAYVGYPCEEALMLIWDSLRTTRPPVHDACCLIPHANESIADICIALEEAENCLAMTSANLCVLTEVMGDSYVGYPCGDRLMSIWECLEDTYNIIRGACTLIPDSCEW